VPNIGSVQAIYYDVAALVYCLNHIKINNVQGPIVYILACRIGPFAAYFQKEIHKLGGKIFVNPDGHEWMRSKWCVLVQKYWKISECLMIKHADLVVCDSINIEKYINTKYKKFHPKTTFIAYGADLAPSKLSDDDSKLVSWYAEKELMKHDYYLVVGRFVPENSFEIMIREFMNSKSEHDFAIITTVDEKFQAHLEERLHYRQDKRIKFVGTVYDQELLKKIRENAYANLHGHTVGGTNPSLIEALASTNLNLLVAVGFNKEVAEDSALYWNNCDGNLAKLIDYADSMSKEKIRTLGYKAKKRIATEYTWEKISGLYERLFLRSNSDY
jgi:rhamnosyltransferase